MIRVLHPGLMTTIQDHGRIGYRKFGVPNSGPMDTIAASMGNALLNNDRSCAQLEIAMSGPRLEFQTSTKIVITGGRLSPSINDRSVSNYKVLKIAPGDKLTFGRMEQGMYAYLSVFGGIRSEVVLGSRSQYQGITEHSRLQKGQLLEILSIDTQTDKALGMIKMPQKYLEETALECAKGPEFHLFREKKMYRLLNASHTLTHEINRMGSRLAEKYLPHKESIITSPVMPGTVQLVPAGNCIVLMRDAQTTGGYPRILQLTEKAIAVLAQKSAGSIINFNVIG